MVDRALIGFFFKLKLNLTVLFHRSYSTNSVKPKPGAYTACGQNDRNMEMKTRLNYKTKTRYKTEIK